MSVRREFCLTPLFKSSVAMFASRHESAGLLLKHLRLLVEPWVDPVLVWRTSSTG